MTAVGYGDGSSASYPYGKELFPDVSTPENRFDKLNGARPWSAQIIFELFDYEAVSSGCQIDLLAPVASNLHLGSTNASRYCVIKISFLTV